MPFVLLAVGLLVVAVGFAYDIAFAGIPFQDPPPELQRRYDRDARVGFSSASGIGAPDHRRAAVPLGRALHFLGGTHVRVGGAKKSRGYGELAITSVMARARLC
jgi:hypothetical protein